MPTLNCLLAHSSAAQTAAITNRTSRGRLRHSLLVLATLLIAAFPLCARAQEIRGTVLGADQVTAVGGVVMVLLHPTRNDSIIARTVTNARGAYSLKAPTATTARLRALRIGFQPMDIGTFTVAGGEVLTIPVTLADSRMQLATMTVTNSKRCDARAEGSAVVAKLFADARTALVATAATVTGSESHTQYTNFTRYENLSGKLSSPVERVTFSHSYTQAYASAPIDTLTRFGYVVTVDDGVIYYAPDANVLLSDAFAAQHCLRLVEGTDEHAGLVGIGFRPVDRPRSIVDVIGTLWLDKTTNELQYLEYTYDPLSNAVRRANLGGRVEYTRMSNGIWFISRWSVRTPMTVTSELTLAETRIAGSSIATTLVGVKILGGEVQSVRVDNNILYANNSALQAGASRDDIMGKFPVTAGTYVEQVPRDGQNVLACGAGHDDYVGSVRGRVLNTSRQPIAAAKVSATWQDEFRTVSRNQFTWQDRSVITTSQDDGAYAVCELPVFRAVNVSAVKNKARSYSATVKLAKEAPVAELDLSINMSDAPLAAEGDGTSAEASGSRVRVRSTDVDPPHAETLSDARYSQVEVMDFSGFPVPYATVTVNGVARVTDTHGVVFLNNVRGDSLDVSVRRVSYAPFQGKIARTSSAEPFRISLLPSAQRLGKVNIMDRATVNPLASVGFYERMQEVQKGASRGEFFTPEDMEARPVPNISSFLFASKYVKVTRWVPPNGGSKVERPKMLLRGPLNCYMSVLIDGVLIHQVGERGGIVSDSTFIDDVVNIASIAAIEVYPSLANAPMSIQSKILGSTCGIAAIWTGGRQ